MTTDTQHILEYVPDAVAVVDEGWRFVYVNAAAERLVSKARQAMVGRTVWEVFPRSAELVDLCAADQRDATPGKFQDSRAGDRPGNLHTVLIRKDSRRVELLITGGPVVVDGKVAAIQCAAKDSTEAQRAEEERQRLVSLVENSSEFIGMCDMNFLPVFINEAGLQLLGLDSLAQMRQTPVQDFFFAEDQAFFWEEFIPAVLRDGRGETEIRFRHLKTGEAVWTICNVFVLRDARRQPTGLATVSRDITARKKAEQRMHAASRRLQSHVENSPVAIIEFDPELCIRLWTKGAQRIFGWTAEEVLGKFMRDVPWIHPEDREKVALTSTNLVMGTDLRNVSPNRNLRKDGSTIYCEWYNSALQDGGGKRSSFFSLVLDVTERVRAEQARQEAKEEAERANQAKDRFLAVLSHELRTPLTPVLATAQLMETDAALSVEQQESVRMIRRNVELEARLIDDLLDLTRIIRGKLSLNSGTVDLHARLEHVLAMCRDEIRAKELAVTVEARAGHHHVYGDAARLLQILWNLVKNTVKFTPVGGRITIRTDNPSGAEVAVVVQDTGVGIAPELLPRLFDAFEQGGEGVTRQFGGLGLGLAISKGLVDLHGGRLTASSEGRGKGATFTLILPTTAESEGRRHAEGGPAQARAMAANRRVLLVEDHADTAEVMIRLLKSYGIQVTLAGCVKDALQAIQAEQFDLLISDIGLPDGSGLELMRQVAAIRPTKAIALSGYGMEEDIRKSKEAGFLMHLTKPADIRMLERVLREFLGSSVEGGERESSGPISP